MEEVDISIGSLTKPYIKMRDSVLREHFDLKGTNPIIYHYTSGEALISILKNSSLRASNILFMNDPTELDYSLELAMSLVHSKQHHADKNIDDLFIAYYDRNIDAKVKSSASYHYSLSFSLCPDSLHFWNAYTNNEGYAIGFDYSSLIKVLNYTKIAKLKANGDFISTAFNVYWGRVLYDRDIQEQVVHKAIDSIDDVLKSLYGLRNPDRYSSINKLLHKMVQIFLTALYNMKQEQHKVEEEFRITLITDSSFPGVEFISRKGIITPQIELGGVGSAISQISLGPKLTDKVTNRGLEKLTQKYLANKIDIHCSRILVR